MSKLLLGLVVLLLSFAPGAAQSISFKDKTITIIVPSAPGGGTDATARLVAPALAAELPGSPTVFVRNTPGADGMTALNFFVQQVATDGLTIAMGSITQSDPHHYRKPLSKYDPVKFRIVGGVGRGGTVLVARNEALPRLKDPKAAPAIMGSIGGIPRSGMQVTAWGKEFLGWNAKWVIGYRGTNDLMLALERGEIEMTATGNINLINKLLDTGNFSIISQSGTLENGQLVGRPDFRGAPIFATMMKDSLADPAVKQAFEYWSSLSSIDKWVALPEATPQAIVDLYREAFIRATRSAEFTAQGKRISEDFETMTWQDVELLLRTLGNSSPDAIGYMNKLLRKQGLDVE